MGVADYSSLIQAASNRYNVPVPILSAVMDKESTGNPIAVHVNSNGTADYGLMQINSNNLAGLGLNKESVYDPATNINAGASILASNYSAYGSWDQALSAYNTGSPTKGAGYASSVLGKAASLFGYNPSGPASGQSQVTPVSQTTSIPGPGQPAGATSGATAQGAWFYIIAIILILILVAGGLWGLIRS